jgi:lipopolysaccharide export system permease protein
MLVNRQIIHRYFSLLDRYLWREFMLYLFAVTSVLWLIFVATRFARYLAQAAVGNLPSDVIFTLLGYTSLGAFSLLLPMGAFFAVMLALGRMNADSELTVIASCGVSNTRLIRNVLIFSSTIALIVGLLAFLWVPDALSSRYELEQRARLSADTSGLISGTFKESRNGEWTFYSQNLSDDKASMENIFIKINRKNHRPLIFRAKKGRFKIDSSTGDKYLILEDGYRYEGQAGDLDFSIIKYASHSLLIEKAKRQQIEEFQKALPSSVLWHRGRLSDFAELQWRAASVLMTVILSVLAISLAKVAPRRGRYAGFFPAILIYIIYSNLLGVSKAWISKGLIAPWFGAIWVHLLMILILLIMTNWSKIIAFYTRKQQKELAS